MGDVLEEKVRIWKDLEEYIPTDEEHRDLVGGYKGEAMVKILKKLNLNQYFPVAEMNTADETIDIRDTRYFQEVITSLNEIGFDVGRGDAEYGFKMPPLKKGETKRELQIFRRRCNDRTKNNPTV